MTVERDVVFSRVAGRELALDIYRGEDTGQPKPALVYLHGGGWIVGDKVNQALPMLNHLALNGWVAVTANYRLSPGATYPDHVVDARAAIAWVRRNAGELGVDPSFIAVSGGSSGGHIAAMAALAPPFDASDPDDETHRSVQAVLTFYGVYDLTNRLGCHNPEFLTDMVGPWVIKAFPDTELERFSAASPRDHAHGVNTPWLVLQGSRDTLTPAAEARDFAAALAERAPSPSGYVEFPGAQHAFDIFYCHRALAAMDLSLRFLATAYRRSREDRRSSDAP